ncbi:MAG: aminoacyl-tRNA hydrolase [Methylococcaceae bacterium]
MIKLIVGLGNPGRQYEKTRHNAGFLFLDELAAEFSASWIKESRFQGLHTEISVATQKAILLKPETFMNLSGQSVGKVARYYKLLPEEILVVHDELDIALGVIKLKKDGGHAGHNGLRDIIAHLNSKEFYRLRIGIGRPQGTKAVADFVLSSPSKEEHQLLTTAFYNVKTFIPSIISGDIALVMNKLNSL